jgi:hypothetical protein
MTLLASSLPILLTSSIAPHDTRVKLKDESSRLHYVLESVEQWLRINPKVAIVLCDGSNYDMGPLLTQRFPFSEIEYLRFQNDPLKVALMGRGYGEGEIVRYAVEHSDLIRQAGGFSKCTAKLWVDNYYECIKWWNGKFLCKGVFLDAFTPLKKTKFHHIDTRFYITSSSFYKDYLLQAHLSINVEAGHGLEECFRDILMRQHIQHAMIPIYPIIQGVGGGIASYYSNSKKRIWKENLRLQIIQKNNNFSNFFSIK